MKLLSIFVISFLCLVAQCQVSNIRFGKCPGMCVRNKSLLSPECAGLVGCKVEKCKGLKPKQFSCSEPKTSGTEFRVQPGQPLLFESLKVGTPYPIIMELFAQPLPVDFYLLADATGSMASAIATVKKEFSKIVDSFEDNPLIETPRFGVGFYRDEEDVGVENGFKNLQPLSADTRKAQSAINKLQALAGGDRDEANLVALYKVATDNKQIKWRKDSRKIVVYFGDVPGHEPTCGPDGRLDRKRVIDALVKRGITVVGISLDRLFTAAPNSQFNCGEPVAKGSQAKDIVEATNGVVKTGSAATLVDDITDAIKFLSTSFSVDDKGCNGKLESAFSPALPVQLRSGEVLTVKQSLTVDRKFCNSGNSEITCRILFKESGASLAPTVIRVKKVTGC